MAFQIPARPLFSNSTLCKHQRAIANITFACNAHSAASLVFTSGQDATNFPDSKTHWPEDAILHPKFVYYLYNKHVFPKLKDKYDARKITYLCRFWEFQLSYEQTLTWSKYHIFFRSENKSSFNDERGNRRKMRMVKWHSLSVPNWHI